MITSLVEKVVRTIAIQVAELRLVMMKTMKEVKSLEMAGNEAGSPLAQIRISLLGIEGWMYCHSVSTIGSDEVSSPLLKIVAFQRFDSG